MKATPKPDHLNQFSWYDGHQAWLASRGLDHHAFPEGTVLAGANLGGANLREANLFMADLGGANLRGADLREANLTSITLCNATIDGAILHPDSIGGPGHILCALTDREWGTVRKMRGEP